MKIKIPPMPEPVDEIAQADGFNVIGTVDVFTAEQLAARDQQWLELVGPLVEALKAMMDGSQYKQIAGEFDWHSIAMPRRESLEKARVALRAITEEQQ